MGTTVALGIIAALLQAAPGNSTLRGVVCDAAGEPVAGARVDIATAAPRVGPGVFCPSCYRDCVKKTETDQEGRFEIGDLDPTLKFRILCTAVGKEAAITGLIDPTVDAARIILTDLPTDLPVKRTVQGQLVNESGQPIAGALVEPHGAKTHSKRWWGKVDGVAAAVSDLEGRFRMLLPKDFLGVDIFITADGYAGATIALLAPGVDEHRLIVPSGTSVTGRLTHLGAPLVGMRVAVVQTARSMDDHFIAAVEAITDADGRFSLEHLPADQVYVIYTPVLGNTSQLVLSTKRFKAYANGQTRDLGPLEAVYGLRLKGRVDLPSAALPANTKLVLGRNPAWDLVSTELMADGSFELGPLPPETYEIRLQTKGWQIDAARLGYQMLGPQEFGLALRQSILDLRIPVIPSSGEKETP